MTLEYCSTRSTVARWYWRSLRRNRRHLALWLGWLVTYGLCAGIVDRGGGATLTHSICIGLLVSALVAIGLALFPQIKFKSQSRQLTLLPDGITTTIAGKTELYSWGDVARVDVDGSDVIIGMNNLNAFIIPTTAFASQSERDTSVALFGEWSRDARVRSLT